MKKLLLFIVVMCLIVPAVLAQETYTLKTGIAIDKVPKAFYGTWRVASKLIDTNAEGLFKQGDVDLWNISRADNVITLENPFSGAKASIVFDEVNDKFIKFKKVGNYDGKKLTDMVELTLSKDTFSGINHLKLDTISDDGHVVKSDIATYKLTGEKISGASIK